jgi:glycosyltransferase involved in cell wall biosynthesis
LRSPRLRLAFVVSHPIQYYAPLYLRLARRQELDLRIFYTWHAGDRAVLDRGFETPVAWDIPLTEGYDFELVPNTASDPGTHHFFGLQNPSLSSRLSAWRPDVVHLTGWAWWSHLQLLRSLYHQGVSVLFRGDSHLLDSPRRGPRWWAKRALLTRFFSWPEAFLYVGKANRAYYEAFGVEGSRLRYCPHSIDVTRFSSQSELHEREAEEWRRGLGISEASRVLLFAGKFETKKQPVALMRAMLELDAEGLVLVLVGGGELRDEVRELASANPKLFRVLPFQNQSRMPIVYRLGDLFVLPSAFGETWGLAVNEALACGRPVLVSSRVGCAADVVDRSCGEVFPWHDLGAAMKAAQEMTSDMEKLNELSAGASRRAWSFDVALTESATVAAAFAARK